MVPLSVAVARTSSSMSRTIASRSAAASARKTTAAASRELIPSVSKVTHAVLIANPVAHWKSPSAGCLRSLAAACAIGGRETRLARPAGGSTISCPCSISISHVNA